MRYYRIKFAASKFILYMSCVWIPQSKAASCSSSTTVGETNPKDEDKHYGTSGASYLMYHNDYKVDCTCGRVYEWSYYVKEKYGDVVFQIWRPESGSFTLVGQNQVTTDSTMKKSTQIYSVPTADQISAKNGDYLGLYFPGDAVVTYDNGHWYKTATIGSLNTGDTYNWYSKTTSSNRDFAFHAKLSSGSAPSITNLDQSRTITDQTSAGTEIITLTVTDPDVSSTLSTVMNTVTSSFNFDTNTLKVTVASPISSGTYTLQFKATDECSQSDTGTLTVTVTNTAPTINNMPVSFSVKEEASTEALLFTITTSDNSPADTVSCSLQSSSPSTSNFFIKKIPSSTSYGIYLQNGASMNYLNVKLYTLSVQCTDNKDTVNSVAYVNVEKNRAPTFTNLPTSVSLPSTSTSSGASVFQVSTTDPEGDALSYSLSIAPSGGPFQITPSGLIKTTSSLSGATVSGYDLKITINDNYNTVGPRTVTVRITDINSAPTISNLPFSISVPENTALGSSIYQVSGLDIDTSQSLTYSVSFTPISGNSLFTLNPSSGIVTTSSVTTLNYETLKSSSTDFTATVTVSDGVTSVSAYLNITVSDVNEAPSFQNPVYYVSGDEGDQGQSFGNPGFVVNDPDVGGTLSYSIDCAEFVMDASTAAVSLSVTYDLDENGKASQVSCIANVTDGELSATATLYITIKEVNDNSPKFGLKSYTFYMEHNAAVGHIVGSVVATDGDQGVYGVVTYSVEQAALGNPYFGISGDGNLYVMADTSVLGAGITLSFTATVTDSGGLNDSASITVIIPEVTTQAVTTTERYRTFWEDTRNVAWMTSLLLTVFGSACFMIYSCYRYDLLKPLRSKIQEWKTQMTKRKLQKKFSKQKQANKNQGRKRNLKYGSTMTNNTQQNTFKMTNQSDTKPPAQRSSQANDMLPNSDRIFRQSRQDIG